MNIQKINSLLGIPYCKDSFDCADLVVKVQKELFGRDIVMPSRRPRGKLGQAKLGALSESYVTATESPVNGDLVLMQEFPTMSMRHVGVYLFIAYEPHVLHAFDEQGSMLTPIRNIGSQSLIVEGYYSWNKTTSLTDSF